MAAFRDLGEFIREQRRNAQISLRQLAEQTGVSNPYLSQIERGLRKPSAEVLQQIANALRVSTPIMYLRAGLLDAREGQGVPAAIAADEGLTIRQKVTLTEIYEAFRRENAHAAPADQPASADADPADPRTSTDPKTGTDSKAGTDPKTSTDSTDAATPTPTPARGGPESAGATSMESTVDDATAAVRAAARKAAQAVRTVSKAAASARRRESTDPTPADPHE